MNIKNLRICCLVLLASCSENQRVKQTLQDASNRMQEPPDSALIILQSLDRQSFKSPKTRAEYALLYSQALDKNYIDVTNDSLIRPAVKYFKQYGTDSEKCLALYYLGCVQHNARDYNSAIISYSQAGDYAEKQEGLEYLTLAGH